MMQTVLSRWDDESVNFRDTNCYPSSLINTLFNGCYAVYCCIIWPLQSQSSQCAFANGLSPIWWQDICDFHNGAGRSTHNNSAQTCWARGPWNWNHFRHTILSYLLYVPASDTPLNKLVQILSEWYHNVDSVLHFYWIVFGGALLW